MAKPRSLDEFEVAKRMVEAIEPLMYDALEMLPDRQHDLVIKSYGLAGAGIPPRRPGAPTVSTGVAMARAMTRAQRTFSRKLENLIAARLHTDPGDPALEAALRVVRGEVELPDLAWPWPEPVSIERIEPAAFHSAKVQLTVNDDLIAYFACHPEMLHLMDPREFEVLTGQLLEAFGYDVRLTPLGRDGGVDVYAERSARSGTELILVQCKLFRPDRKVGEPIIKQLYAEVEDKRATRGLVVTNSFFTQTALNYIEVHRYRLSGADGQRMREWLRVVGRDVTATEEPVA